MEPEPLQVQRRRLRPLRVHLLFLVLGAMLPGALLTAVLVSRAFSNNRAVIERRLLDSARVDAAALDRELESTIVALQTLATSPSLDTDDMETFYAEARRVQLAHAGWYSILLLTPDGQQLVSTRLPWGTPLSVAHEPDSLHLLVESREPVVGLVREPPRGGPEYLFPVRVPVFRYGEIRYALTASIDTARLGRLIKSGLPASEEWTRALLDPAGTIAARTRDAPRYVGHLVRPDIRARLGSPSDQVFQAVAVDGTDVYAVLSKGTFGWTASVSVPLSVLDAPIRGSNMALFLGGALLVLSGLAAVLVISRRVLQDLASVARAAEAVVVGRPTPPVRVHVAETRALHDSLRAAATLLENRERERDREVERAEAARAGAEQANRTKDHFLAVLGHELRNPLAPALTALELLKRRDPTLIPRERQLLERQIGHMVRLVDDLLDLSRLARGKVDLVRTRFELRRAVDRAADMARPLMEQRRHELRVDVAETGYLLDADEDRVVQVLVNLLTNAAKYTPPGGHVSLVARREDGEVHIVCEDDGPGISDDLLPTLFEPFSQGPRTFDRRQGGLGLGLSLARRFTELHGGTIHHEGRAPEGGSRFVVKLPVAEAESIPLSRDRPALEPPRSPRRILVVDDNIDAVEMLRAALEQIGHVVSVATDGPAALSAAATFAPEVAVLDIGLPGMNGYEVARELRRENASIRLIALTGYGQPSDSEAAARAGFDVHCKKPITISSLLDRIDGAGSEAGGSGQDGTLPVTGS